MNLTPQKNLCLITRKEECMTQATVQQMDEAMQNAALKQQERRCRICKCTERNACRVERTIRGKKVITGCAWIEENLCDSPSCLRKAGFTDLGTAAMLAAGWDEEALL